MLIRAPRSPAESSCFSLSLSLFCRDSARLATVLRRLACQQRLRRQCAYATGSAAAGAAAGASGTTGAAAGVGATGGFDVFVDGFDSVQIGRWGQARMCATSASPRIVASLQYSQVDPRAAILDFRFLLRQMSWIGWQHSGQRRGSRGMRQHVTQ